MRLDWRGRNGPVSPKLNRYIIDGRALQALAGERGPVVELLRPVLDTYTDSAVAVIGCHSSGIARESCEYDVLVVSEDARPKNSVKVGDFYFDLLFLTEKEALKPSDPETAVSMASAKTVKDSGLVLSTASSVASAILQESARRSAEGRLAASLKALGRADEALSQDALLDADFWLLAAAYDYAFAWLFSSETRPAPSHLLEQLKHLSKGSSTRFEAFSKAAGLERASRQECSARLDSMSVLYDVIDAPSADPEAKPSVTRVAYQIVREKSVFLVDAIRHVDCYSYLGYEVVERLPELVRMREAREGGAQEQTLLVSSLCRGSQRMIGEGVVRGLGLGRDERALDAGLAALREQVSGLAKRT